MASVLLDRYKKREEAIKLLSQRPRLLVCGDMDAGVHDFISWLSDELAASSDLILIDFNEYEGDCLDDVVEHIHRLARVKDAYSETLKDPSASSSMEMSAAYKARAKRDIIINQNQAVKFEKRDRVGRLAKAVFNDLVAGGQAGSCTLVFSGIVCSRKNQSPDVEIQKMIKNVFWAGASALEIASSGLRVVIGAVHEDQRFIPKTIRHDVLELKSINKYEIDQTLDEIGDFSVDEVGVFRDLMSIDPTYAALKKQIFALGKARDLELEVEWESETELRR